MLSVLAALTNAAATVLQRRAHRDEPAFDRLGAKVVMDALHHPGWFAGLAAVIALVLLQHALASGILMAAQPGITTMDPIVSILWGVPVFHEQVRGGWVLLPGALCVLGVGAATYPLSRSPLLIDHAPQQPCRARGVRLPSRGNPTTWHSSPVTALPTYDSA